MIRMSSEIAVIGDGAMGTICAIMLAENGCAVRLWSAFPEAVQRLDAARINERFLPGCRLPDGVAVTGDDAQVLMGVELAISAVPAQFMRSVWGRLADHCPDDLPLCSVAKGIENQTLLRPTQVLADVLDGPADSTRPIAALSGPSIAPEVAARLPATVVVASGDEALARRIQELMSRPYFRIYTNPDLVGVELAGATKNVIAIAAGLLDGLACGCNAKAALLTRGLVEITRLGVAMGALGETFAGLAGAGDLVTTCFSPVGRNRSFGEAVGQGMTVAEALGATDSVVEGVATTAGVVELARRHGVDMPITQAINCVLTAQCSPAQAIADLMTRPLRSEC